jgi:hypothetical protein
MGWRLAASKRRIYVEDLGMGLAKRLSEIRDDMQMVVRMLRPDGVIEPIVVSKKEVCVLTRHDGRETLYIPKIAGLEAYRDYKVIEARVKE